MGNLAADASSTSMCRSTGGVLPPNAAARLPIPVMPYIIAEGHANACNVTVVGFVWKRIVEYRYTVFSGYNHDLARGNAP